MKSVKNKIFWIVLTAIFYFSCTKDQTVTTGGPPGNLAIVYAHTLDTIIYAIPTSMTSYAHYDYVVYVPQLDTAPNPVIKLYYYSTNSLIAPKGWNEIISYTRQGGHFAFTLFNLGGTVTAKLKISAKW